MSQPKNSPLIELLITIVIPSVILMKLSGPEELGSVNALLLALAFPLGWGLRDLVLHRTVNLFAVLGLVSTLLTGGIGLLQLDTQWIAIKEAAIPAVIGLVIAISALTPYPLIRVLIFSPKVMDVERIQERLEQRGNRNLFEARLRLATWMLSGSFLFSAIMNYLLATWVVISPTGTAAFNEELGRMTLLSYPVIALPATLIMAAVLYYLSRAINELAGLKLAEAFKQS